MRKQWRVVNVLSEVGNNAGTRFAGQRGADKAQLPIADRSRIPCRIGTRTQDSVRDKVRLMDPFALSYSFEGDLRCGWLSCVASDT
jgi:hypothetical protein